MSLGLEAFSLKKPLSYPLGITDATTIQSLKTSSLLPGAYMYLGNEAGEAGRQRQPVFTHKIKTGTGLRRNQG